MTLRAKWLNLGCCVFGFLAATIRAGEPPMDFAIRVAAPGPDALADRIVQEAIDTVAARGGGVVELGAGDFKLARHAGDETIIIKNGVTLRGQGYATHLYLDPTTPPQPLRYYPVRIGSESTPASNVVIENLRYTGNNAKIGGGSIMGFNARLGDPAALTLSCDNISIRNCWIYDAQQAAGCTKPGGRDYGAPERLASQFKNWRVCGNVIDTCGNKAVELAECNGGLIADNFIDNTHDGPQVIFGSRNVQIRDNHVLFTDTGINITEGSNHIRVSGNFVEPVASIKKGTANACLLFRTEPQAHTSEIFDVVVTGNIFRDQTTTQKGTLKFITRPESLGCVYRGITFTGNVFDGDVLFLDRRTPAMTTIKDILFADNICEGDMLSEPGKTVASSNVVVRGNMLRKPAAYVVNADRWVWSGNTFPGGTLMIAAGADSNTVRDNVTATPIQDLGTATDLAGNLSHPISFSSMNSPWTRRNFLHAGCLGAVATLARPSSAQDTQRTAGDAVDIGGRRQHFIDDALLDLQRTVNVTRRLNGPHKIQRVLKPEQPWEALGFVFYCGVIDDGGTVRLYHHSYDGEKKKHSMLATSADGLHWERPSLGVRAYEGSAANNLLALTSVESTVFLDPHSPPEKRYRMVYTRGWPDPEKAGVCVASSPDGVHWNETPERCLPFVPDSQPSAFWDERIGKYVVYLRTWNPIRAVARVAVDDLETAWPYDASVPPHHVWGKDKIPTLSRELPTVLAYDEQDQKYLQPYTSEVMQYPGAPDVYFAFPADFQNFKGPDWQARALNTSSDGTFDIGFASSRDGITWNRSRQPYLPIGLYDDLDLRLVSMGFGMVRRGPWLHQYFVGWPYTHAQPTAWEKDPASREAWSGKDRGGIYCATQRVDGFLSMDALNDGGTLTTRPLVFKGTRLRLNIHTTGGGSARVALLDVQGQPFPGFAAEDCEVIQDDAIDFEVRWKNGADVGKLAGQHVRVQVAMRNAKLYALQFAS